MLANYGIKQNPYIVHDLKTWNNYFNENQTVKKGYYRIIKDIDFRAVGGNPSTSALTFSGNIQGNNMVLSNIMLYSNESLSSIGLFEKLEGINDKNIDNAVRNLTLSASSIWASSTSSVGVLAGIIEDFNVYNINIDSEGVIMVGGNAVGGLAGTVCGDFDLDLISSNIGANSTRASILTNYSIYMSKTNKKAERYNLNKVYYAGSVAGILDGYDKGLFNLSKREINKNYFKAKNIFVNGRITLFGDTVGCAFGLVGERVYVKNMTVDVSGSLFGHEYSAGAIGENRGVADNLKIVLADDVFEKSQYVSSGAVGFNLGGLVMNAEVSAKIIKTGYFQTVAGVIGRNVLGNVNNSSFDGELFGNITGGIIGANYNVDTFKKATTGSGAIAYECITNTNLVPLSEVQFTQNENVIKNYNKLSLSKNTFVYLIENSRKYYSYKHEDNNPTLSQITVKSKVLGLVIGLSNNSNIVEKPNTTTYNITLDSQKITFNSLTTEDYANQKLPSVTYEAEKADVELYRLNATNVILHTFKNINVLTMGAGGNFVMYLVGGEATSFDSWTTYSEEYILVQ